MPGRRDKWPKNEWLSIVGARERADARQASLRGAPAATNGVGKG
jgi:hypothetical protein